MPGVYIRIERNRPRCKLMSEVALGEKLKLYAQTKTTLGVTLKNKRGRRNCFVQPESKADVASERIFLESLD